MRGRSGCRVFGIYRIQSVWVVAVLGFRLWIGLRLLGHLFPYIPVKRMLFPPRG